MCDSLQAMFVLHCILHNIIAYLEPQVEAAVATWRNFVLKDPTQDAVPHDATIHSSMAGNAPRAHGTTAAQQTDAGTPGLSPGGTQAASGARNAAHRDWTPEDVPDEVQFAVSSSDERELRRVSGLTQVQRVPGGETEMYIDRSGRYLGMQPVRAVASLVHRPSATVQYR